MKVDVRVGVGVGDVRKLRSRHRARSSDAGLFRGRPVVPAARFRSRVSAVEEEVASSCRARRLALGSRSGKVVILRSSERSTSVHTFSPSRFLCHDDLVTPRQSLTCDLARPRSDPGASVPLKMTENLGLILSGYRRQKRQTQK